MRKSVLELMEQSNLLSFLSDLALPSTSEVNQEFLPTLSAVSVEFLEALEQYEPTSGARPSETATRQVQLVVSPCRRPDDRVTKYNERAPGVWRPTRLTDQHRWLLALTVTSVQTSVRPCAACK